MMPVFTYQVLAEDKRGRRMVSREFNDYEKALAYAEACQRAHETYGRQFYYWVIKQK